jgi:teichuronic acid biosynthesis glycosyltransferase TuaC
MHLAVITTSYPAFEGDPAGHFVESEVAELERTGHRVTVLRPPPGGAFGWPGAPTRIRERPTRAFGAAAWVARAAITLRRARPDRVIAHWCVPSAFPIALHGGSPPSADLEIVSHGGDVRLLRALPPGLRTSLVRRLLGRADRWRFVSDALRESLLGCLSAPEASAVDRIASVVPATLVVPDVAREVERRRTMFGSRRLYVCAGRLVPGKRIDKVIDYVATSDDHGTRRQDRTLVVLGDGPERRHLECLARAWRMDVRFLGTTSRRETLGWIGAADEVVHASQIEGLSTLVREAEHLGVAVTLLP